MNFSECDNSYEIVQNLGKGAYGVVYEGRKLGSNSDHDIEKVAIKERAVNLKYGFTRDVIREIKILKAISLMPYPHPNIIELRDVIICPERRSLQLVYEYCNYELNHLIKQFQSNSNIEQLIKSIMRQILEGLSFLHENWIIHRDLKPANILVKEDGQEFHIKISDFGLARIFQSPLRSEGEDGTVVTLWYRAPELLLGSTYYTRAIDMWSVGCIFGEMLIGKPIFRGKQLCSYKSTTIFEKSQFRQLCEVLGQPTVDDWKEIGTCPFHSLVVNDNDFKSEYFPKEGQTLNELITLNSSISSSISHNAIDLLEKMLCYDPGYRISARNALFHPWFSSED